MSKNEIISKLAELFETKFQIYSPELVGDFQITPLTSAPFYMDIIKLTYLYFEISNVFAVDLSYDDLADYSFLTVSSICDLIYRKKENSCTT
jgi:acyl carrier protein